MKVHGRDADASTSPALDDGRPRRATRFAATGVWN